MAQDTAQAHGWAVGQAVVLVRADMEASDPAAVAAVGTVVRVRAASVWVATPDKTLARRCRRVSRWGSGERWEVVDNVWLVLQPLTEAWGAGAEAYRARVATVAVRRVLRRDLEQVAEAVGRLTAEEIGALRVALRPVVERLTGVEARS